MSSRDCCPNGQGWFRNVETGRIERCDECARYVDDVTAARAARKAGEPDPGRLIVTLEKSDTSMKMKLVALAEVASNMADNAKDANMRSWSTKLIDLSEVLETLARDFPTYDPNEP